MTENTNTTTEPETATAAESPTTIEGAGTGGADPTAGAMGEGGKRALQKEREARRDAERRAAEAETEANELKSAELRRSVADEMGLTKAQARYLQGDDREALEESASDLLAAFPAKGNSLSSITGPLRSGATGDTEGKQSMGEVAADVMKGW